MTSPEPIIGPSTPAARSASVGVDPGDTPLPTELLHRHLSARVAAARRQLEEIELADRAPDRLVATVGATVVEARRSLSAERAESELRSEAFERVARRRGAEILAEAEAEARVLRAAATWVRQVRLAGPPSAPMPAELPAESPVLAALEARAS